MQAATVENTWKNNEQLALAHVPHTYQVYPGETLTMYTCLLGKGIQTGQTLMVMLPSEMRFVDYEVTREEIIESFLVSDRKDGILLVWKLKEADIDEPLEFQIKAEVLRPDFEGYLNSKAELLSGDGSVLLAENFRVNVRYQSEYIKYLPEIYQQDEFMGRFLMLFESFWKPIDQQIRHGYTTFDAGLTPDEFLPWLASWVGIYWDEFLPEKRRRKLLQAAVPLFQKRGTKDALVEFLEIYTDGKVEMIEHRANNFVLGKQTRLGNWMALGKTNFPHTFTIDLWVNKDAFDYPEETDRKQIERYLEENIKKLIDGHKPAHTAYTLNLKFRE